MLISSPRERFSLSPALVFWYPNTSHKKFLLRPQFGFLSLEVGYDIIPHSPLGNPVDIVELGKRLFSRSFRKKSLSLPILKLTAIAISRICAQPYYLL